MQTVSFLLVRRVRRTLKCGFFSVLNKLCIKSVFVPIDKKTATNFENENGIRYHYFEVCFLFKQTITCYMYLPEQATRNKALNATTKMVALFLPGISYICPEIFKKIER